MGFMSEQLTEALGVADVLNQTSINNTSSNSALYLDMSKGGRGMYIIQCASLGAAGTVDARLQSSANANFNVIANITGTNITQVTQNNALVTIEVRADQVKQQNPTHRYVHINVTGGGNALTAGAVGFLCDLDYHPTTVDLNSTFMVQRLVCNS